MPSREVMPKFYRGQLRSSSGQKVTNPRQAKAIAASEHAKEKTNGGVYPEATRKFRGRKLLTHKKTRGK